MPIPELALRQLRTFVAVAERRSFTRAAEDLHLAQQAVSQQVKALERSLDVTLLRRNSRKVELTSEGTVFLADCRRVLAAADRAARRVRAAARGEAGTLRLVYTLTTVWETIPSVLERLGDRYPQLQVRAREVWGGEITRLLIGERCDLAIAPATSYPAEVVSRTVRREPLVAALGRDDPLARRRRLQLTALSTRRFELWPRAMAPGFYDSILAACRAAGFEPELDEHAAGNTVWGNLARGRGVALINASFACQLPAGIRLVPLRPAVPELRFEAVWRRDESPAIERVLEAVAGLAAERRWV